tara:strand:+ start:4165 stop:4722 length:558 start_codon:yes stop_codon:yes gene_type:complete
MQKPKLIAFVGLIGSGKTLCADYLCRRYGYTNIKFAGPLKRMLKEMGLTDEHLEGALKEQPCDILDGKTPRWAMQTLGTEWGRNLISENLWGNVWEHHANLLLPNRPVVTDDCRFQNEAERVKRMGGMVVRLVSEENRSTETAASHSSEHYDYDFDVTINNPGDKSIFKALDFLTCGTTDKKLGL